MSAIRPIRPNTDLQATAADPVEVMAARNKMERVRRVVCHHQWETLMEWVGCLDELGDLSDDVIDELVAR